MLLDGKTDSVDGPNYLWGLKADLVRNFINFCALKSILVHSETNIINRNYILKWTCIIKANYTAAATKIFQNSSDI